MKKQRLIIIMLILVLLLMEGLKRAPLIVEVLYSKCIYPSISLGLHHLTSWTRLSIGEIGLYLTVLIVFGFLCYFVYLVIFRDLKKVDYQLIATNLGIGCLVLFILFNSLWGLNYHRMPLSYQLGVEIKKHTQKDLTDLCRKLVGDANYLADHVAIDARGVTTSPGGYLHVFHNAMDGYDNLGLYYALFYQHYQTAKPVHASWIMSYSGISGIYSPFTAEANVNIDIEDVMLPSTTLHEMAHLYGIAREDEANFTAYLSAINNPDPYFQYSGTMLALIHAMNTLHKIDTEAYMEIRELYSDRVMNDMKAINTFWKKYDGPVNDLQDEMNDQYLKANGQQDGIESYGRMVDLLLEMDQLTPRVSALRKIQKSPSLSR